MWDGRLRRVRRDRILRATITAEQYRWLRARVIGVPEGAHRSWGQRHDDLEQLGGWCADRLDIICATGEPRQGIPHIPEPVVDGLADAYTTAVEARARDEIDDIVTGMLYDHLDRVCGAVTIPEAGPGNPFDVPAVPIPLPEIDDRRTRWTAVADAQGFDRVGRWASDVIAGLAGAGWSGRTPSPSVRRTRTLCRQVEDLLDSVDADDVTAAAHHAAVHTRKFLATMT